MGGCAEGEAVRCRVQPGSTYAQADTRCVYDHHIAPAGHPRGLRAYLQLAVAAFQPTHFHFISECVGRGDIFAYHLSVAHNIGDDDALTKYDMHRFAVVG